MIPYDDLVAALSAWRARQGLPVSTLGGGGSGPTAAAATPGSGPNARPGSGPNRAAPPPAPPSSSRPNVAVAEVEEAAEEMAAEELEEGSYENEGNDFAMSFGANAAPAEEGESEATSIGQAPERPTEMDMDHGADKDDW
jgi:hypothetical protein